MGSQSVDQTNKYRNGICNLLSTTIFSTTLSTTIFPTILSIMFPTILSTVYANIIWTVSTIYVLFQRIDR